MAPTCLGHPGISCRQISAPLSYQPFEVFSVPLRPSKVLFRLERISTVPAPTPSSSLDPVVSISSMGDHLKDNLLESTDTLAHLSCSITR